ncbi:hypothetical protein MBRA_09100 [Mycobacterium branderi]|uniref:ER-bound oxygenase mpaB/mpaB'/Rubber oxygenase catalytic domain-containing protein n=1 Tax=Mycobacterium branderi TaxID=43348 RepID=A0ABM7KI95_9MYCO|nr:hypothetical protein MBRA_09100 [Mycobacterium branderi]
MAPAVTDAIVVRLFGKRGRRAVEIAEAPRLDDGYFGPGSISWEVWANPAILAMAGILGSIVAVLDPVGAAGVSQHSSYPSDPLGRVQRSNAYFVGAVFGDSATADKVGRDLFRRHSHVNGVEPTTGKAYRANELEYLIYTYVTGWPCLWDIYKAFSGKKLTEDDERAFYAENNIVGELLGIPSGMLPRTPEEVEAYVRDAENNKMALTPAAQELIDFFLHPPFTPAWPMAVASPFLRVVTWAALSQMRPGAREVTGIPAMPIRTAFAKAALRIAVQAVKLPIIDRLIALGGFEAWGYRHNAFRHTPGTGRVPFTHDPGLRLQQGKGGTLPAPT